MAWFERPGDFDENSFWYLMRSRDDQALDQAVKARRQLEQMSEQLEAVAASSPATSTARLEAKVVDLEHKLMSLGLYARAILHLLQAKGVLTGEEFDRAREELDLLDGR